MTDSLQIFNARSGQPSARIVFADGSMRHLHSLIDPALETEFFDGLSWWGEVLVFAGMGLGYHVVEKVKSIPPAAVLVVIDYYEELLTYCKKQRLCGLPNRMVFISSSTVASTDLAALLPIDTNTSAIQVVKHPPSYYAHEDFYTTIVQKLFAAKLKPAPRPARPKRALLFFGSFFLEEEALRALQAEGVEPMVFSYNTCRGTPDFEDALQRAVQTNRPDFVLSINMKGFDGFGAAEEITARLGVPLVVWFVDDPRPILMHRTAYAKNHLIAACWERSYLPYLREAGCAAVAHVPLATDRTLFFPGGEKAPRVNVGFIGTAMVDAFAGRIRDKFLWSQSLSPLVELVSEQLLANPSAALGMEEAISVCAKALTITLPFSDARNITWLATYCIHTASMKKRNRIIGNLISYGIETFGDPEGWKELLGPALPTHPNIDYRRGLRDAYRDILCNVNVTSCQMPTAVNQRVFDIPSCGSFVISDNQPDMRELFALGTEAIVYETIDDLKEKISFYTSHETARQGVIRAGQNRIAGEHTYNKRLHAIVAMVRG